MCTLPEQFEDRDSCWRPCGLMLARPDQVRDCSGVSSSIHVHQELSDIRNTTASALGFLRYSLPEVMQMLKLFPEPARTIVAVAAFLGLRRSEIRGLEWQDKTGSEIRVMRSRWESFANETKTRTSKAPVPVILPVQRLLDQFRLSAPNHSSGSIFATIKVTALSLNNALCNGRATGGMVGSA